MACRRVAEEISGAGSESPALPSASSFISRNTICVRLKSEGGGEGEAGRVCPRTIENARNNEIFFGGTTGNNVPTIAPCPSWERHPRRDAEHRGVTSSLASESDDREHLARDDPPNSGKFGRVDVTSRMNIVFINISIERELEVSAEEAVRNVGELNDESSRIRCMLKFHENS